MTPAALPRAADRAELDLLLRLFESRVPRPFTSMAGPDRERFLRGWATSGLPLPRLGPQRRFSAWNALGV